MALADYDKLAKTYDRRYRDYTFDGVEQALLEFARGAQRWLEVGCGTGHWVDRLQREGLAVTGLDASRPMLDKAQEQLAGKSGVELVHGRAEALPFADASFDRVVAVHAFHHFSDADAFLAEARRVLRPGGGVLIIGLEPHTGHERWWVYDYYPGVHERDRVHYAQHQALCTRLAHHGFVQPHSAEVQQLISTHKAHEALAAGKLDKHTTSQLARMSDAEYSAGIARVRDDIAAAAARGEELLFHTDLRVYATQAWVDPTAGVT